MKAGNDKSSLPSLHHTLNPKTENIIKNRVSKYLKKIVIAKSKKYKNRDMKKEENDADKGKTKMIKRRKNMMKCSSQPMITIETSDFNQL